MLSVGQTQASAVRRPEFVLPTGKIAGSREQWSRDNCREPEETQSQVAWNDVIGQG